MSTKITGTVAEIIYRNPDNGYTVCELDEDDGHIIAATGYMPYVGSSATGSSTATTADSSRQRALRRCCPPTRTRF